MSHPIPFYLPSNSAVLVGGGRALAPGSSAWVACQAFTSSLACADRIIHVGCATGADQAVILCCPPRSLRVFAAFSASGTGAFSGSAVKVVRTHSSLGGSVRWLAGGPLSVPLAARLITRSMAALAGCSAAVFFQPGVGSLKVARRALVAGIPVLVATAGISSAPVLAVPAVLVSWFGQAFWLFAPTAQGALF